MRVVSEAGGVFPSYNINRFIDQTDPSTLAGFRFTTGPEVEGNSGSGKTNKAGSESDPKIVACRSITLIWLGGQNMLL
jgi:hypothetical protein